MDTITITMDNTGNTPPQEDIVTIAFTVSKSDQIALRHMAAERPKGGVSSLVREIVKAHLAAK